MASSRRVAIPSRVVERPPDKIVGVFHRQRGRHDPRFGGADGSPMGCEMKRDRELKSWKEIAESLGVSVRTAQKLEEDQDLPIKRHGIGPKARVSISAKDLSDWKLRSKTSEPAPPSDIKAERQVLAMILVNNENLYLIEEMLKPEDFYLETHRAIFSAMVRIIHDHKWSIDLITLTEELHRTGEEKSVGGVAYIASLLDEVPYDFDISSAADTIKKKALIRRQINNAKLVLQNWHEGKGVDMLLQRGDELIAGETKSGLTPLKKEEANVWLTKPKPKTELAGLATGIHDFDCMTGGLKSGELVVFAGAPSSGKTAFLLNIAEHVTFRSGGSVGLFSSEIDREQLLLRVMCSTAMVDLVHVRSGHVSKEDHQKLVQALEEIGKVPLYVDDNPRPTIESIRAQCLTLRSRKGLDLVIIDSFQMVMGQIQESRRTELSRVSRELKAMARELRVPVVVSSQLSRSKNLNPPTLRDLDDASCLEQDADVITLIHREELLMDLEGNKGAAELIVAKQRVGPRGVIKLAFLEGWGRFENLMEKEPDGTPPQRMFRNTDSPF